MFLGACLLLAPMIVLASVDISSESNSHVYSDIQVTSSGNGEVEVSHTSIINGEKSSYHYATSSPHTIDYRVEIQDGEVLSVLQNNQPLDVSVHESVIENELSVIRSTSNVETIVADPEIIEKEISWLWFLINYLYTYVEYIF